MTGDEHYAEGERLLDVQDSMNLTDRRIALAQAHFTAALAARTQGAAIVLDRVDDQLGRVAASLEWHEGRRG